jgi:hypothetical protein
MLSIGGNSIESDEYDQYDTGRWAEYDPTPRKDEGISRSISDDFERFEVVDIRYGIL